MQLAIVGLLVPGEPQDKTASKENLVQVVVVDSTEDQESLVHQGNR